MHTLPRLRLSARQQPIATSALAAYFAAVVSTAAYLGLQGDERDACVTAATAADAASAVSDEPVESLRRHALNALLVPLLDDGAPPRWVDPATTMNCDPGSVVLVDGRPLVPGERIPPRSFSLRWHLVDCRPLSSTESFDGDVLLQVFHEDEGYSAIVEPQVVVRRLVGTEGWTVRFAAVTP